MAPQFPIKHPIYNSTRSRLRKWRRTNRWKEHEMSWQRSATGKRSNKREKEKDAQYRYMHYIQVLCVYVYKFVYMCVYVKCVMFARILVKMVWWSTDFTLDSWRASRSSSEAAQSRSTSWWWRQWDCTGTASHACPCGTAPTTKHCSSPQGWVRATCRVLSVTNALVTPLPIGCCLGDVSLPKKVGDVTVSC